MRYPLTFPVTKMTSFFPMAFSDDSPFYLKSSLKTLALITRYPHMFAVKNICLEGELSHSCLHIVIALYGNSLTLILKKCPVYLIQNMLLFLFLKLCFQNHIIKRQQSHRSLRNPQKPLS